MTEPRRTTQESRDSVNFFGHAVVAARYSSESAFVFGAMVPDFASMLQLRTPTTNHSLLADGIAFHHRTDRVFHDCATFCRLSQTALEWLLKAGLRRGSAKAIAHIGVEILLDGALTSEPGARHAYRTALEIADAAGLGAALVWRDDAARMRFEQLRQLLLRRVLDDSQFGSSATPFVTYRLERAIAGRPRLALQLDGPDIVARWVDETRPLVFAQCQELMLELTLGLSAEQTR